MSSDKEPASYIQIIPSSADYADQMEALTGLVYGVNPRQSDDTLTADHFRHHLKVFPEGQFVAIDTRTERVVGLTASMRIHYNRPVLEPWWRTIGHGWLTTHVPDGEWMYGVESCVHPDYRGRGVGSQLMDARFHVLRRLNLRGMVAGGAIIDYHQAAAEVSAEQYVQDVIAGRRFDTNLSKQLHKGFRVANLIPDFLEGDAWTLGWGVSMVWDNPDYRKHPRWSAVPPRYLLRRDRSYVPVFR